MKLIVTLFIFILSGLNFSNNIHSNNFFYKTVQAERATDRLCGSGKPINCSAPIPNPYNSKFHGACAQHDYCYRFGHATYGYERRRCDIRFYKEMNNICTNIDWAMVATGGLSVSACLSASKIYAGAVIAAGASSFKKGRKKCNYKGFCPEGKFSTTGTHYKCTCPVNTKKIYTDKITNATAHCQGFAECPTGKFATDGAHRGCKCPGNKGKKRSGPGDLYAKCKGSAGIATCPKGKFSTTGKFYNCKCPGGKGKRRWGVGKVFGQCKGSYGIATCPTGKFKTIDKYRNCSCPKGTRKKRTGVFNENAQCVRQISCPTGKFKTTGKYHGCSCKGGKGKKTFRYGKKLCKGSAGRAICPTGKFKTTGKFYNCSCRGGSNKKYSGIGKSHAMCRRTTRKAICPNSKFSTTGRWRGCKCPSGKKKKYTNWFKSKARCKK